MASGFQAWLSTAWRTTPTEPHDYQRLQAGEDGEATEMRVRAGRVVEERDEEDLEPKIHEGAPGEDVDITKPFPIDPDEPEEMYQLTWRALIVGSFLGGVVGASNIYLGLKTGFTFGAQLFGAIFGFAILKPMSRLTGQGTFAKLLGGDFGPKENCTVQTAATAAGALGTLFVSAIPAMYNLGLLTTPSKDVGKLIALTACSGFFGMFFVIPLRRYYIIKQKLAFPTPSATAYTIRALHNGRTGALTAARKSRALLISFLVVFFHKIASGYAPGILANWHVGWWLDQAGLTSFLSLENYGWWIQFTPAFFGAGMLSGLNASWSFFGGTVLAWGIIAPYLVSKGLAVGEQTHPDTYPGLWTYTSLTFKEPDRYLTSPSPRYWLLWPGVLVMLVNSFTEVALSMGLIFFRSMRTSSRRSPEMRDSSAPDDDADETPSSDEVPTSWWTIGLSLSTLLSSVILVTMLDFTLFQGLFSLLLGFLFSFIGVQSSGQTDVNPVGTVAKASQVIFGGVTRQAALPQAKAEIINLTAGVIAAGSSGQATDMVSDLKTGYLLRAKPRVQFIAQLVGSTVSVFLNVGLFILFVKSSPCIITGEQPCPYGAPAVAAWAAVAVGVTSDHLPVPLSSGYTALFLALLAAITVMAKHLWIPKAYQPYIPNWNAIGLAFVVHQTYYSVAMVFGAMVNAYWQARNPTSHDLYMFAISAGLLAGEGLGGVTEALLAMMELDGGHGWGSTFGCPASQYCG